MSLSSYLTPERVRILAGRTKPEFLKELVTLAHEFVPGVEAEVLAKAIEHRETLMSTGIGQGLAVPHTRLDGVTEPMVVVGISKDGVAGYDSLDGEPVHVVLLIVAGKGQHEPYLRLLATSVELLKDPAVRQKVINSETAQEAFSALTEA